MKKAKVTSTPESQYNSLRAFFQSADFKVFEKNALINLAKILKRFNVYGNPKASDFAPGIYEVPATARTGSDFQLQSRDLSEELGVNNMKNLSVVARGVRLCAQKFNAHGKAKTLPTVRITLEWDYNPRGYYAKRPSDRGQARVLDVDFDLRGRVAIMLMHLRPQKIVQAEEEVEALCRQEGVAPYKLKAAQRRHLAFEKEFEEKCLSFVDKTNALHQAGFRLNGKKLIEAYPGAAR